MPRIKIEMPRGTFVIFKKVAELFNAKPKRCSNVCF